MALEMRNQCEKCGKKLLEEGEAYICVHECTFCTDCSAEMDFNCPNCSNELVRRPRGKK